MRIILPLIFLFGLSFISVSHSQIKPEWVQRYNGTANSYDIVTDIVPDDSGNVFVYGTSFNTGTATDITVVKYNSAGGIVWEKKFNFGENSYDQLRAVYKDSLNNSYLCGYTTEGMNENKMITLKVDALGNLIWHKIFAKLNYTNLVAKDIEVVQGVVYVTGDGVHNTGRKDPFLLRYNLSGDLVWEKRLDNSMDLSIETVSMVCLDSNTINIGLTKYTSSTTNDMLYCVWRANGTLGVVMSFPNESSNDRFIKFTKAHDNTLIYLGTQGIAGDVNFRVGKIDLKASYPMIWQKIFNGLGNHYDFPYDVCVDSQNNVLVTGSSRHGDTLGTEDIVTLKYSSNGDLLWSRIYNSDSNGIDQGMSITTDAANNVYVGGASDLGGIRLGYKILKYSPTGNLLWHDNYSIAHHPEDFVYSVKVNKKNDLFVTGISFNPGTDYDFATIKYSQTAGIENISGNIPGKFYLAQNYPNPFNGISNIEFSISDLNNVSLKVYDINGREIETLYTGKLNAGTYKVQWNSNDLPSGVYFYELMSENFRQTKKMILIK